MNKKLIGKWQFVCWKVKTENGWEQPEGYSKGQFVWDFRPDGTLLIESSSGGQSSATEYYICPDELLLAIDRSDYAVDGFLRACIEDHYRIGLLTDRYMILYDLEDVEVEPDEYALKMELEMVI